MKPQPTTSTDRAAALTKQHVETLLGQRGAPGAKAVLQSDFTALKATVAKVATPTLLSATVSAAPSVADFNAVVADLAALRAEFLALIAAISQ